MIRSPFYLVSRTALLFLFFAMVGYVILRAMPGDPLDSMLENNPDFTYEDYMRLRNAYGLDDPLPIAFGKWLSRNLQGDAGYSRQYKIPVQSLIAPRLTNTLILGASATMFALVALTLLGVVHSVSRHWTAVAAIRAIDGITASLPPFVLGLVTIAVFSVQNHWLPPGGIMSSDVQPGLANMLSDRTRYLIMPSIVLGFFLLGPWLRRTMNEVRLDPSASFRIRIRTWLRTARSGVGLGASFVFGGAVIVEPVFSYPGIGKLLFDSVLGRDYVVSVSIAMLMVTIALVAGLICDLLHNVLNRSVAHGSSAVTQPVVAEIASPAGELARQWATVLGGVAIGLVALFCFVGPAVSPYGPMEESPQRFSRPSSMGASGPPGAEQQSAAPSRPHLLGTDEKGRDIAARAMFGGSVSLVVGMSAGLLGLVLASAAFTIGIGAGKGRTRVADVLGSLEAAIPDVAAFVIAIASGGFLSAILLLGLGVLMVDRERRMMAPWDAPAGGFIDSGSGQRRWVLAAVLAVAGLCMARAIYVEAALSYFGIGVPPPLFSWGSMFSNAQQYFFSAPWVMFVPALLLFVTLLSLNIVADGLWRRD